MIPLDLALLVLRISLGATFIMHGKMKMAMWKAQPSEQTPAGMIAMMKFLSIVEPLGGLGVLLGVLTWWAAAGLGIIMIGAFYFKAFKWNSPFASVEKMGWEVDLMVVAMCLVLMATGPGAWALGW